MYLFIMLSDDPLFPIIDQNPDMENSQTVLLQKKPSKSYLIPSLDLDFGKEWSHPKFSALPSTLDELPDIHDWSKSFLIKLIEIWSGRRPLRRVSDNCHKVVNRRIIHYGRKFSGNRKVRRIYVTQPIEGVSEITVTLCFQDRVKSLSLRFEGIDKRWICTELMII
jgi:hypothetical protein